MWIILSLIGEGVAIWWTVWAWNEGSNWCLVHFFVSSFVMGIIAFIIYSGFAYVILKDEEPPSSSAR